MYKIFFFFKLSSNLKLNLNYYVLPVMEILASPILEIRKTHKVTCSR